MRLFSSGGRWKRKRSWDVWKCLGHGGSPGTRSLHAPHPAGSPAPGEHRVGSSRGGEALPELRWLPLPALPVTRCQQQQLFQVPKVGGGRANSTPEQGPSSARECFAPGAWSALGPDMSRAGLAAASEGQELRPGLAVVSASLRAAVFPVRLTGPLGGSPGLCRIRFPSGSDWLAH